MVGIDGLDKLMISRFLSQLPNFGKLRVQCPDVKMSSVFPPDTMPAWVSIYTGLNPAKHGVVNFMDSGNRKGKVIVDGVENDAFRGRTFWDVAGAAGKRVCVVLPYAVYPAYPVNGVMVCRTLKVVPEDFPVDVYPESAFEELGLDGSNLNLFHGFPSRRGLGGFLASCRKRTLNEAGVGLRALRSEPWDLFFIYLSALDAVQHTFWSYCDESHPDYPGRNAFECVIRDFYVLFDRVVGDFVEAAGEDTAVVALSDHGHGMRPVKLLNVNEVLRRGGFLVPKGSGMKSSPLDNTEALKRWSVGFVNRFGIGGLSLRVLHRFPSWKRVFASPKFIDYGRTRAYVSDLSAIKCYSYCGVIINRVGLNEEEYERLRTEIIAELSRLVNPESGKRFVKWCRRREEVYDGEHCAMYPDLLLELVDDYGAGWSVDVPLNGACSSRGLQPGCHKAYSAVFLASNLGSRELAGGNACLMDVAPTILDILEVEHNLDFDGESLMKIERRLGCGIRTC